MDEKKLGSPDFSPTDEKVIFVTKPGMAADPHSQAETKVDIGQPADTVVDELSAGTIVAGKYRITALIGTGGMSAVYLADDIRLRRQVAIKVLYSVRPHDNGAMARFEQEAVTIARLNNDRIVHIYEFGRLDSGKPYMVMDYLSGQSVASILSERSSISRLGSSVKGGMEYNRALLLVAQVAEALSFAHSKGVIHRDIKPSNIFVTPSSDGGAEGVRILDFGIAKIEGRESAEHQTLTQTGEIFGSPLYMSPEQCTGKKPDQRTDVYSLGCCLYEMITGVPPLVGDNPVHTLLKHISLTPSSLSAATGGKFPRHLEAIVAKMLAKEPADRYQTMDDLRADLLSFVRGEEPVISKRESTKRARSSGRKRAQLIIASLVLVVIVLFGVSLRNHRAYLANPEIDNLQSAVESHPSDENAWFQLGKALYDVADNHGCINAMDHAVQLRSSDDVAWNYLGNAQANVSNYPQAIAAFHHAIDLEPNNMVPRVNLAIAQENMNLLGDAEQSYLELIKMSPDDAVVYGRLGQLYARQGKFDQSITMLRRAMALDRDQRNTYLLYIGDVLIQERKYQEAADAFGQVARCDPNNIVLNRYADALFAAGKPEEAQKVRDGIYRYLPEAHVLKPNPPVK